jgi:hypothetical protein
VLALFARSDPALVLLYLLTAGAAYGATRVVARRTLVHGRALLSAGIAVGVLVATVVAVPTTLVAGLLDAALSTGRPVMPMGNTVADFIVHRTRRSSLGPRTENPTGSPSDFEPTPSYTSSGLPGGSESNVVSGETPTGFDTSLGRD